MTFNVTLNRGLMHDGFSDQILTFPGVSILPGILCDFHLLLSFNNL